MIGDPSGRSSERNLLVARAPRGERRRRCGPSSSGSSTSTGPRGAIMANNLDWLEPIRLLDFLRDVGKHFTIPYMLAKDSVQVAARGRPVVHRVQLHAPPGGRLPAPVPDARLSSCRWAAPTSGATSRPGLELIRRTHAAAPGRRRRTRYALAYPLLLNPSGAKFGKSEGGDSVWLHPDGTSPYAFYQHWLNTDDRDVPARTCAGSRCSSRRGSWSWRRRSRRHPSGARRSASSPRPHGARPWRRRGCAAPSPRPRPRSPAPPITDPAVLETLHRAADGFDYTRGRHRRRGRRAARRDGHLVLEGRGPPLHRRRRDHDQRSPDHRGRFVPARADRGRVVRPTDRQAPRARGPPRGLTHSRVGP